MKKYLIALFCLFCATSLEARLDFANVYPPVEQILEGTTVFDGDYHGDFVGNLVAHLSDASTWKIHPDSHKAYREWHPGEHVRVMVRTDFYWFKREHKFLLYNYERDQTVKVMLVQHRADPFPLQILATETFPTAHFWTSYKDSFGNTIWELKPTRYRKLIALNDGTFWVIKSNFNAFQMGDVIYIGAQGRERNFYDFVMISGTQREAAWTWARPKHQ